ncbi:hypothetical protein KAR91_43465, partial [Candidatus Pacearchaeota archaeon]|nr:hypothetical protein [Candidatus Pacearchaeota archaeon]
NISAFFQCFDDLTGEIFEDSKYSTDQLVKLFIEKQDQDIPLLWFDRNIKKYFNIDIYKTIFPDSGIARYTSNNIDLLILQIDVDDSAKEDAISDFVELPGFKLKNRNLSKNKAYNNDYRALIKKLKLPESYLTKMSQSKYFKHFYSEKEINEITSKFN